jgi:hypothetical protein
MPRSDAMRSVGSDRVAHVRSIAVRAAHVDAAEAREEQRGETEVETSVRQTARAWALAVLIDERVIIWVAKTSVQFSY